MKFFIIGDFNTLNIFIIFAFRVNHIHTDTFFKRWYWMPTVGVYFDKWRWMTNKRHTKIKRNDDQLLFSSHLTLFIVLQFLFFEAFCSWKIFNVKRWFLKLAFYFQWFNSSMNENDLISTKSNFHQKTISKWTQLRHYEKLKVMLFLCNNMSILALCY